MPVNFAMEFLKSMNTEDKFFGLFSQNFEFLFPSFDKFFKNFFSQKTFQIVSTISGFADEKIRQP